MKEENAAQVESGEKVAADFFVGAVNVKDYERVASDKNRHKIFSQVKSQAFWSTVSMGLEPGQRAVIANGKVGVSVFLCFCV